MKAKTLVIVEGVAGGACAAARARRLCEDCEILVFERGPHVSFANCGLPYFVGGEIIAPDALLLQTPETLRARFNLEVRVNTEVVAIDRARQVVRARDLAANREYEHPYDALVLSTGASPLQPPIPGIDRPNHFTVGNIPDVEQIMAWSGGCQRCRAVIVGGGYIGLEMAAQNVVHGDARLAQWSEIAALDPARTVLLDVRRADELPRDREIIVHCQSGQRSYFACRLLNQRGFGVRNLAGSWRTWSVATNS